MPKTAKPDKPPVTSMPLSIRFTTAEIAEMDAIASAMRLVRGQKVGRADVLRGGLDAMREKFLRKSKKSG